MSAPQLRPARWTIFLALLILAGAVWIPLRATHREHSQDTVIRAAARRYDLHPALVKAVVWRESRFDPAARGPAEELGLMQLREEAAREWAEAEHLADFAHEHCLNPATNTLAGAWYLKKCLSRYRTLDDPLPYALADYNAGRGNVLRWARAEAATNSGAFLAAISYPGTRAYVRAVQRRFDHYRPEFER